MRKRLLIMGTVFALALTSIAGCSNNEKDSNSKNSSFETDKVKVAQYKGLNVEFAEPTNEEIEKAVDNQQESLLTSLAKYKQIKNRVAKKGDRVNIDYKGLKDKKAFDGGTATGTAIVLGSSGFIDGFDDGVIGMKAGEEKKLNLTFPKEYSQNPTLAGEDVVFEVKFNYIEENTVTELTDELVEKNTEYKTIEEYREGMKKSYLEYNENYKMNLAWSKVVEESEVKEIPEDELKSTKEEIENSYSSTAQMYNMSVDDYLKQVQGATVEEYAKKTITSQYLVDAISEKEKLTVSDDEYKESVTKYTKEYNYKSEKEFIEKITEEKFKEYLLSEKVANFVKDNAKFVEPKETEAPVATASSEEKEQTGSGGDVDEVPIGDEDKAK